MSKVYALMDERGVILRIDGGYSTPSDLTGWTQIDEGEGDRYNLCQTHYLPELTDRDGVPHYKMVTGKIVERTAEEMEEDRPAAETPAPAAELPSAPEEMADLKARVSDLEGAFETLMTGETNED